VEIIREASGISISCWYDLANPGQMALLEAIQWKTEVELTVELESGSWVIKGPVDGKVIVGIEDIVRFDFTVSGIVRTFPKEQVV
jgi:hypothetical protein